MSLAEDLENTYPDRQGERNHANAGTMHMLHDQIYGKGGRATPIIGLPLQMQPNLNFRLLYSVRKRLQHGIVRPLKLHARSFNPVQYTLLDAVNGKGDPRRTGREGGQVENPSNDGRVATLSFAVGFHEDAGDGRSELSACVYSCGEVTTTSEGVRKFLPPVGYVDGAVEFAKHESGPAARIHNIMDFPAVERSLPCLNYLSWRGRFHHNTRYPLLQLLGGDDELPRNVECISVPPPLREPDRMGDVRPRVFTNGYVVAAFGTHAKKGTVATSASADNLGKRLGAAKAKNASRRASRKPTTKKRKRGNRGAMHLGDVS